MLVDLRDEEDEMQFWDLYPQGEYDKARSASRALADAIAQTPFTAVYTDKSENWFLVAEVGKKDKDTSTYSLASGGKGKAQICGEWILWKIS